VSRVLPGLARQQRLALHALPVAAAGRQRRQHGRVAPVAVQVDAGGVGPGQAALQQAQHGGVAVGDEIRTAQEQVGVGVAAEGRRAAEPAFLQPARLVHGEGGRSLREETGAQRIDEAGRRPVVLLPAQAVQLLQPAPGQLQLRRPAGGRGGLRRVHPLLEGEQHRHHVLAVDPHRATAFAVAVRRPRGQVPADAVGRACLALHRGHHVPALPALDDLQGADAAGVVIRKPAAPGARVEIILQRGKWRHEGHGNPGKKAEGCIVGAASAANQRRHGVKFRVGAASAANPPAPRRSGFSRQPA